MTVFAAVYIQNITLADSEVLVNEFLC